MPQETVLSKLDYEELLNRKIKHWGIEGKTRGRSGNEKEFCLFLDKEISYILSKSGCKFTNIAKEFLLKDYGRIDYLIKTSNGQFLIIEVKHSNSSKKGNSDTKFIAGIGQLLGYKTILSSIYKIPFEKIKLALFIDIDSLRTLAVINSHNLGIDVYVVGSNSVKIYKNNGQTNKI